MRGILISAVACQKVGARVFDTRASQMSGHGRLPCAVVVGSCVIAPDTVKCSISRDKYFMHARRKPAPRDKYLFIAQLSVNTFDVRCNIVVT